MRVVTPIGLSMGLALGACGPRVVTTANPPPPAPDPAPAEVAGEPVTSPHEQSRFVVVLNGVDAQDRRVYKNADGGCYVIGPWTGPPPTSYVPPPTEPSPCPPHMDDSWLACAFGTVQASADGAACVCHVAGNPPAPPRTMPCPTAPPPTAPPIDSE